MNLGNSLRKTECYNINAQELITILQNNIVDEYGNVIKVDPVAIIRTLDSLWYQVRETVLECENKQIIVELPETVTFLLKAIGLDLNRPVTPDSKVFEPYPDEPTPPQV